MGPITIGAFQIQLAKAVTGVDGRLWLELGSLKKKNCLSTQSSPKTDEKQITRRDVV